jgi:ADP-heptose:LPS heptosyltransferase
VRVVANIKNALNFAGQVSFAELPPLYTLSDVMVTNDSGPGHFSAVTPLRTVVLFGPETPALYGSIGNSIPITANLACSPCVSAANHRKTPCQDNVCMQAITVSQVLDKVGIQLQDTDKAKGR